MSLPHPTPPKNRGIGKEALPPHSHTRRDLWTSCSFLKSHKIWSYEHGKERIVFVNFNYAPWTRYAETFLMDKNAKYYQKSSNVPFFSLAKTHSSHNRIPYQNFVSEQLLQVHKSQSKDLAPPPINLPYGTYMYMILWRRKRAYCLCNNAPWTRYDDYPPQSWCRRSGYFEKKAYLARQRHGSREAW